MSDEEAGAPAFPEKCLQPLDGFDVEMVGGFVEQQQVRLSGQSARQQHAAAHSARKRVERHIAVQPELGQEKRGAGMVGLIGRGTDPLLYDTVNGALDIFGHVLGEVGDPQSGLADDLAGVGRDQPRDDLEEGGLPLAVASGDAGPVAGVDAETDGVENGGTAILDADIAQRKKSHR